MVPTGRRVVDEIVLCTAGADGLRHRVLEQDVTHRADLREGVRSLSDVVLDRVRAEVGGEAAHPGVVVHSTSWRRDPDALRLTWMVHVPHASFAPSAEPLPPVAQRLRVDQRSVADGIAPWQVAAHGAGHLHLLSQRDPAVRAALQHDPAGLAALRRIPATVAQPLEPMRSSTWSARGDEVAGGWPVLLDAFLLDAGPAGVRATVRTLAAPHGGISLQDGLSMSDLSHRVIGLPDPRTVVRGTSWRVAADGAIHIHAMVWTPLVDDAIAATMWPATSTLTRGDDARHPDAGAPDHAAILAHGIAGLRGLASTDAQLRRQLGAVPGRTRALELAARAVSAARETSGLR